MSTAFLILLADAAIAASHKIIKLIMPIWEIPFRVLLKCSYGTRPLSLSIPTLLSFSIVMFFVGLMFQLNLSLLYDFLFSFFNFFEEPRVILQRSRRFSIGSTTCLLYQLGPYLVGCWGPKTKIKLYGRNGNEIQLHMICINYWLHIFISTLKV